MIMNRNKPHRKPWGMKAIKQFFSEDRGYTIEEKISGRAIKYRLTKNIGGVTWIMGKVGWYANLSFVKMCRKVMNCLIELKMEQKEGKDK